MKFKFFHLCQSKSISLFDFICENVCFTFSKLKIATFHRLNMAHLVKRGVRRWAPSATSAVKHAYMSKRFNEGGVGDGSNIFFVFFENSQQKTFFISFCLCKLCLGLLTSIKCPPQQRNGFPNIPIRPMTTSKRNSYIWTK